MSATQLTDTTGQAAREQGVSELAEVRIRQGIVAGEFRPGEHLSERELCELTGVSRAAVREAIRTLASEGLITVVRFRGPIVTQLTEKEARNLYEMRALLESHCASLFVQRASDAQVAALNACVQDIGRGHADGDMLGVIDASRRFYEVLAEGADNGAISQALATLHNRMALFRFSSTRWPGRAERSMSELREIGEAVQARDAERAAEAARIHIERAAEMALLIIAEHQRALGTPRNPARGRR
ncbi:GntR family transcriptional regulator [Hoeflea ulvae]|uniref:GntR family transcriptional regulator n=1 Tax=Hoeflea ulvae TaxID=2983764 RepID=A0ABT3YCZ1_9HYPH|nr:GntR family transcriptional regulator [Hoeflea ulvae]MCY0093758.1 GntR family transcriptional regulator [Hoeflea ulvae]